MCSNKNRLTKAILNKYTQSTIFNTKEKITLNYPKSAAVIFFQGTQD